MTSDNKDVPEEQHLQKKKPLLRSRKLWLLMVCLTVVVIIVILGIIPQTRYGIAGLVLKQYVTVKVVDQETQKPVTDVSVSIDNLNVKTDQNGVAHFRVKVGPKSLLINKTYYAPIKLQTLIPIIGKPGSILAVNLHAIGRQVPVRVTNAISGDGVENALITAAGSSARTDKNGAAIIVLPADKQTVQATITVNGFNIAKSDIKVTSIADDSNILHVTPSGSLYFLSNLSGKIDVVRTNLDGTDRQTIITGTGSEDRYGTVLLATQDWRYLALLAKREASSSAKLYLIDTVTNKMTSIDQGDVTYDPVGWSGHRFIYKVTRNGLNSWQPNQQALKSFNTEDGSLVVLDQTSVVSGSNENDHFHQQFSKAYIMGEQVIYAFNWDAGTFAEPKFKTQGVPLMSIGVDGSNKQTVRTFTAVANFQTTSLALSMRAYESNGLYLYFHDGKSGHYYIYESGTLKENTSPTAQDSWTTDYVTYLLSPDGSRTFWTDQRDGKHTLFVGDQNGDNSKQIAMLSDYTQYGWYTDQYLLLSKNGSELYIMPVKGGTALKVTDYYKPSVRFEGYGSGYGGL